MTAHLRPFRPSATRLGLGLLGLGVLLAGAWAVGAPDPGPAGRRPGVERRQPGKPPATKHRREEEEEDEPRPSRKVEDPDAKPKAPETRPVVPAGDLERAAREAKHFAVKQLFRDLAVPHDVVHFLPYEHVKPVQHGRQELVEPLPQYVGNTPSVLRGQLTLKPFNTEWQPLKPYPVTARSITAIVPYEQVAWQEVREFLDKHYERFARQSARYLSRYDQLLAAEHALTAAVRFHESAKERGVRRGPEWEAVEGELRKQLLDDVLLPQLDYLAEAHDWDGAYALTRRLAENYPRPEDQAKIARPLTDLLQVSLKDPTASPEKLAEARARLRQLEEQFPNNDAIRPITEGLREQAQSLFDQAKALGKAPKDLDRAQELLRQAEETWPNLPGLHAYRLELDKDHPVLRVGVELPVSLSPARACTDTELCCVELLFEGLVKFSPDEKGAFHYRTGLSVRRPEVVWLGRRFRLPRNAAWSNGKTLTSGDIRHTVDLLKKGRGVGRSAVWGELLERVEVRGDPFRVDLTLHQGYLDPLSLMTFKVLPNQSRPDPDGEDFAKHPIGSGPFRYVGQRSDGGPEYAQFLANPGYSSRQGKFGLPRFQEVRLYAYKDPVKEFGALKLHLALGLTAAEAAKLIKEKVAVPLPGPGTPNRRVYFLAANHRGPLASPELRRALAHAIPRERLLDDHFRTGLGRQVHKAINSPYPAGSWPTDPKLVSQSGKDSLDLYDEGRAQTLFRQAQAKGFREPRLTLKYPSDDPALPEALAALAAQVKKVLNLDIELEKRDPHDLRNDVEEAGNYQLAYYHYDFPDETYWLGPLLGGEGNYLNYRGAEVRNLLQESMTHRAFPEVQKYTRTIHGLLVRREMPVIPLWQLDPLVALNDNFETVPFDPLLVFTDVELWKPK